MACHSATFSSAQGCSGTTSHFQSTVTELLTLWSTVESKSKRWDRTSGSTRYKWRAKYSMFGNGSLARSSGLQATSAIDRMSRYGKTTRQAASARVATSFSLVRRSRMFRCWSFLTFVADHAPTHKGKLLKTKVNTIGTFSVGKTWELDALRGLESHDVLRSHNCYIQKLIHS